MTSAMIHGEVTWKIFTRQTRKHFVTQKPNHFMNILFEIEFSLFVFFIIQGIYSVIRISEYELIAALQVKDVDYIETLVQK